jgi:hypothetical protein
MTYVEEEFPKEPIMVPPDSLIYTVLDQHDRPNTNILAISTMKYLKGGTFIVPKEAPLED